VPTPGNGHQGASAGPLVGYLCAEPAHAELRGKSASVSRIAGRIRRVIFGKRSGTFWHRFHPPMPTARRGGDMATVEACRRQTSVAPACATAAGRLHHIRRQPASIEGRGRV